MLAAVCCMAAFARGEQETTVNPQDSVVDTSQISRWITELDDNRYTTRENAQQQLENVGQSALSEVARAAAGSSLESATRALNILLSWSESSNSELRIAALEQIVVLPNRPTESEIASNILADVRENTALELIIKLGGVVANDSQAPIVIPGRQQQPSLQLIINSHWKGGVDGLRHLQEVRRVTTVSLHSAPLGDEAVETLANLPQVRRFEIYGTNISREAIDQLREKLPNEVILAIRSAARLGIQGSLGMGGAQVKHVVADSAAQKAGLRAGDLITEINGEEVKDFNALTVRIAKHQPGESAMLKIVRGGKEQEVKVTFDQWGSNAAQLSFAGENRPPAQIVVPKKINLNRR